MEICPTTKFEEGKRRQSKKGNGTVWKEARARKAMCAGANSTFDSGFNCGTVASWDVTVKMQREELSPSRLFLASSVSMCSL